MDYKYINQLLDRYWKGETSLEEEEILRAFFSQDELPAELKPYQALFSYEMGEAKQEALGDDFDQKMMAMIEDEYTKKPNKAKVVSLTERLKPLFKAAAVVAIQQARSRHRAFGLQDHGYADGGIHRCRRQPVPFLLQAASAPGKQPVRYRERKSGRANHGSIGLHQRHDGYLCLRYLSEDQRNKSADSIETKQAFLIFLRKSVLNKER